MDVGRSGWRATRSPPPTCAACSLPARPPASAAGRSWSRSRCTRTRSAAPRRVGLAALVRMAPAGLAAPLTGLAADRFPRRDVLLAALIARAAILAAAAIAVALDAPFALLLVFATLFTVAATAHKPAQAALLPHLAPSTTRQAAANALWTAIDNGAFVVGRDRRRRARRRVRSARGVRGQRARVRGGGAFVLAGIPVDPRASTFSRSTRETLHSPLEGLRVVARDRRLRLLVGVLSASTFVEGAVDVLVVVIALRLVDLGDAGRRLAERGLGDRRDRRRRRRAAPARARASSSARCRPAAC